jgi:hypothetical protein
MSGEYIHSVQMIECADDAEVLISAAAILESHPEFSFNPRTFRPPTSADFPSSICLAFGRRPTQAGRARIYPTYRLAKSSILKSASVPFWAAKLRVTQSSSTWTVSLSSIGAFRLFSITNRTNFRSSEYEQGGLLLGTHTGRDVSAQTPSALMQTMQPPEKQQRPDPMARAETWEFVRAYYRITDPVVRKRVFDLTKAVAKTAE